MRRFLLISLFIRHYGGKVKFILGYMIVFIAQLSVSFSNDYFDIEADRFTKKTLFSGGSKVLVEHPELRRFSKWLAISLIIFI